MQGNDKTLEPELVIEALLLRMDIKQNEES